MEYFVFLFSSYSRIYCNERNVTGHSKRGRTCLACRAEFGNRYGCLKHIWRWEISNQREVFARMQIFARSHEHKIRTVTAGRKDYFWVRRPTKVLLQLEEWMKEERETEGRRKREREKEKHRTRGTKALGSIRPETNLRNPSQPTDTQNWDSVIVSSVRCTWKRKEFLKVNPRIDFTLSFRSTLDNINYNNLLPFIYIYIYMYILSNTSTYGAVLVV